jgi:serine phosphatase RsbU (regulator of sigma subunit)
MLPASEVGGDYYDIISTPTTCWFGIGDVAGHGLRPAMIMLMLQSIVAALVRADPQTSPSDVLTAVNAALWDNIRKRLHTDEHVTCTLLGCDPTGEVRFAGAHEDILVFRNGRCERIETPGAWLAAVPDVAGMNKDRELQLASGDLLVLLTDGITEAMNATHEQFQLERVISAIERTHTQPVAVIRDAVLDDARAWMAKQVDDMTLVVARFR